MMMYNALRMELSCIAVYDNSRNRRTNYKAGAKNYKIEHLIWKIEVYNQYKPE